VLQTVGKNLVWWVVYLDTCLHFMFQLSVYRAHYLLNMKEHNGKQGMSLANEEVSGLCCYAL
jgi:hypothetical protein